MKGFESKGRSYVDPSKPMVIRIDGHCFSKFTRGLRKPYEEWLHIAMVRTTAKLVKDFSATMGYTQSDEITLIFLPKFDEKN